VELWIPPVNLLVEGAVDEAVVRQVIEHSGLSVGRVFGGSGKQYLLGRLPNYNQAARHARWLAVVDLDQDAECAPEFVEKELPEPSVHMQLRVAVRAIEAWLMADRESLASYLRVSPNRIPTDPDTEPDPKTTLLNLARRSRSASIREDMVPREGSGARVGRGYVGRLAQFVQPGRADSWKPGVAALHSDSLRRCIEALQAWRED
jgi:hypothetical protein